MTAPDPVEAKTRELVAADVLPENWREEQGELSDWVKEHPPLPAQPGRQPLSELVRRMRAEDRS